ncbi:MAG: hypothetical protein ACQEXX_01470 [Bacillota bacterium]
MKKRITTKNRNDFRTIYLHLKPQELVEKKSLLKFHSGESTMVSVLADTFNKFIFPFVTFMTVTAMTIINSSINHSNNETETNILVSIFNNYAQYVTNEVFRILLLFFVAFVILTSLSNILNSRSSDEIRKNESLIDEIIELKKLAKK